MSIRPDARLLRCAEYVTQGGYVLDVGTDHAYLPCYLVENGVSVGAAASDISDGPLLSAKKTVGRRGLESAVMLIKSDGLKDIPEDVLSKATDIVVAGMGGELIAKIVCEGGPLLGKNYILQPNTRAAALRRALFENGFVIEAESAVRDGKFLYTVICGKFSGKKRSPSELECEIGGLDPMDIDSAELLKNEAERLLCAARGLETSPNEKRLAEAQRLRALADKIKNFAEKG